MNSNSSYSFLYRLKKQWQFRQVISTALKSAGPTLVLMMILYKFFGVSFWFAFPIFAGCLGIFWFFSPKADDQMIARHLNSRFSFLEESSELLLQPQESLTLLEKLQVTRLQERLSKLPIKRVFPFSVQPVIGWITVCVILTFFIGWLPLNPPGSALQAQDSNLAETETKIARTLPQITGLKITITPPSYTGKPVRMQQSPDLHVEQGATVEWNITLNQPVDSVYLLFNEKEKLFIKNNLSDKRQIHVKRVLVNSGFYQVVINGKHSDYYTIEVIEDKPPVVVVSSPEPYTNILFGQSLRKTVELKITDDYGIRDAFMVATVAKGSGEAVKFREEKMNFSARFKPYQKEARVTKELNLEVLKMEPGDELYFYIQARDNLSQQVRTDMYFISLEDTANVATLADLSMGINPMPEYFRSQRQIIIDTEKLIKQRSQISKEAFEKQSNNIGIDQKILRLRYGKFLGEEFESTIGGVAGQEEMEKEGIQVEEHYAGDGHDHSKDEHLLESFMHMHDQSEEATFFEPALKAQLKAALAQMWEAELRLRTYRPKEALPFEYKALQLLKDVQQKSRAYVSKTGFEPPPLKPIETRLTGELDKILQPALQTNVETKVLYPASRQALIILEGLKLNTYLTAKQIIVLEQAGGEMASAAIEYPGRYLSALKDLRQLMASAKEKDKNLCYECILSVEKALWQFLPPSDKLPQASASGSDELSEKYFEYLQP